MFPFRGSTLPEAGRLLRQAVRPSIAPNWIGKPSSNPRLPYRHLWTTHHPRAIGISIVGKPITPPTGKVRSLWVRHSANAPPKPRIGLLWYTITFFVPLFFLSAFAPYLYSHDADAAEIWRVLESVPPESRPPELVRLYLHLEHVGVVRSLVAALVLEAVHPPCSCHLDGLAPTAFAAPGDPAPWFPYDGKLWLGEARQVAEQQPADEGGSRRRVGTTVITLYAYMDIRREQMDEDIGGGQSGTVSQPKWTDHEETVFRYLEHFRKVRGANHDTELEVVVVCRNGYRIFQCDGRHLNLKREGWSRDEKLPASSIGFHWMRHPKTGHQPSKAQTTSEAIFYRPEVAPQQCRYKKHSHPQGTKLFNDE
ncbi:hypothetical protein PG985_012997 [Apiospora marii]|uniref:Uncharacterized protein n=1 Tax=Apiospora marii TaxID=335849 RepID=A0ABR1RBS3_9PEZI